MGVIPTYDAQVEAQSALPSPHAEPDAFGITGMQHAGEELQQISGLLYQHAQSDELAGVRVKEAAARQWATVELAKRATEAPAGDQTFADKFTQDFTNHLHDLGADFQTGGGRRAWEVAQADLASQFAASAGVYQVQSAGVKAKQDYMTALNTDRNTLAHDPTQFQAVLNSTLAALDDPRGPYARMPADAREALKNQTRQDLALSAFDGVARLNPNLALRQLKDGQWDQYIDADKHYMLESRADTLIRAQEVETLRVAAAQEKAARELSKHAENQVISDLFSDHPKLTAMDIANDPALEPNAKLTLLAVQERTTKPDPLAQVSHDTSMDLFQRIHMQDGDPRKIIDESALNQAFVDGKLNRTDLTYLRGELAAARTVEGDTLGKRQADFLKAMEPQIDHSNPLQGSIDMSGKENMYRFSVYVDQQIKAYRRAGKNPYDLFDPAKPDYVGKPETVSSFQKTLQQSLQEFSDSMREQQMKAGDMSGLYSDNPRATGGSDTGAAAGTSAGIAARASKTATNAQGTTIYLVDGKWVDDQGNAVGDYNSAADVTAAYMAGKISREQATKILIDRGWARASTSDATKQKELALEKAENAATVGQGIPGLDPSQLEEPDQIDPRYGGNSALSRALFGP